MNKKTQYIPLIIILLGNIFILNNYFGLFSNQVFLANYDARDIIVNWDKYNHIIVVISIIYFAIYILSLLLCLIKIIAKKNRILIYIWIISLLSTIMPILLIRYVGVRYCFPFIIATNILIIYLSCDKNAFIYTCLFVLPFVINIYIAIAAIIAYLIFKKIINFNVYFQIMYCIILIIGFLHIFIGYKNNKVIHDYNEKLMLENKQVIFFEDIPSLIEIPKKREIYCWHTFYSDYSGFNVYYVYLDEWLNDYYGSEKIYLIEPSMFDVKPIYEL